jgi:hypothetical protein
MLKWSQNMSHPWKKACNRAGHAKVTQEHVARLRTGSAKTSATGQARRPRPYSRRSTEDDARAALTVLKGRFTIEVDHVDGVSEHALQDFPVTVIRTLLKRWPAGEYPVAHRIRELGSSIQQELAAASPGAGGGGSAAKESQS